MKEIPATDYVNTQQAKEVLRHNELELKKDRVRLALVLWGMIGIWVLQEYLK